MSHSAHTRRWVAIGCLLLAAGIAAWVLTARPSEKERALRAVATGRVKTAMALYEAHLRKHPDDHSVRVALGNLCQATDLRRAIELFEAVPPGAPEYRSAQRQIAAAAMDAGNDRRAEKSLLVLVTSDPDDAAVRHSLAEMYLRTRSPKKALPHALLGAELQPDRTRSWLLLAEVYDDLHRTHEMIAPLRRALEIEPDLMDAHLNLCYALVWSGALAEGRDEARWCLNRDPKNVAARRMLALCERDEGRPELALREIQTALEIAPDDLECRLVEAQLLLFLRRADESYRRLRSLEPRHRDDRRLLNLLARAAAASGRSAEAADFQKRSGMAADSAQTPPSSE